MDGDWAKMMKQCENQRIEEFEASQAPLHWAVYGITAFVVLSLLLSGALG